MPGAALPCLQQSPDKPWEKVTGTRKEAAVPTFFSNISQTLKSETLRKRIFVSPNHQTVKWDEILIVPLTSQGESFRVTTTISIEFPVCPCLDPHGWVRSAHPRNSKVCADCSKNTKLPQDQTLLPLSDFGTSGWSRNSSVITREYDKGSHHPGVHLSRSFPLVPSIQLPTLTACCAISLVRE